MSKLRLACGKCGHPCISRIDILGALAPVIELDTETGEISHDLCDSYVDWEVQRPAQNPPEYLCRECGEHFTEQELREGIEHASHPANQ